MKTKRRKILWALCPLRLFLCLFSGGVILLLRALRSNHGLMKRLSENRVRPVLQALGQRSARVSYSVAELALALLALFLVLYILYCIEHTHRRGGLLRQLYRLVLTLACLALTIYAGFCALWGVYYYGDDFAAQSGVKQEVVSTEQLTLVTAYFAGLANTYAEQVPRDVLGICAIDRDAVLERSGELYAPLEQDFACLAGAPLRAKPVKLSRLMSYLDFTGFFFPFTGEANVNMDFPSAFFPATVAHELAHQRGVAKEQEANFVAVLACLRSGDPEYVYSAALLAYTHLSNALSGADREAWGQIDTALADPVRTDIETSRTYWQRFETPVQEVSNTVYESFLQSYDQTLGLKSYGACVDLLVNYYYESVYALYGGNA